MLKSAGSKLFCAKTLVARAPSDPIIVDLMLYRVVVSDRLGFETLPAVAIQAGGNMI